MVSVTAPVNAPVIPGVTGTGAPQGSRPGPSVEGTARETAPPRTDPLLWSVLTPAERALAETTRELGPLVYGRRGPVHPARPTDGIPAALGGRIDVRV